MEFGNKNNKMRIKILYKILFTGMLSIGAIIFSCNSSTKDGAPITSCMKEIVTIYDYQIQMSNLNKKELRDSIVAYIDTIHIYNRKNWIYALNDSVSVYTPYAIERDSFFLENVYCPNLDTIYLKYENREMQVIKSEYDLNNSIDEEMYAYWNHEYGLIALYNYPWGVLILFDKETMKDFAKETFYNYIINQ